jgi:hypothetical protein
VSVSTAAPKNVTGTRGDVRLGRAPKRRRETVSVATQSWCPGGVNGGQRSELDNNALANALVATNDNARRSA